MVGGTQPWLWPLVFAMAASSRGVPLEVRDRIGRTARRRVERAVSGPLALTTRNVWWRVRDLSPAPPHKLLSH